jgi:FkbM family methyltransferase
LKQLAAKAILGITKAIGSGPLNAVRSVLPISVKLALSHLVTENLSANGKVIQAGNGLKFLSISDTVFLHVLMEGFYEKAISNITAKLLRDGDTVSDIGANFGWYSMLLAQRVGENGEVYSFEPNPIMYQVLKKNIELNHFQERVFAECKGVGESRSALPFAVAEGENGLGRVLSAEEMQSGSATPSQMIDVAPLDELLSHKIGKIAFMKIDVEGFEPFVILGGKKIFESENPPVLQIEYNSEALLTRGHRVAMEFTNYINAMEAQIYEGQSGRLIRIDRIEIGKNADLFIFPKKGNFSDRFPKKI